MMKEEAPTRKVVAVIEVDDDVAISENLGTIEYFEREFGWLAESKIFLQEVRLLDEDDKNDAEAVSIVNRLFLIPRP